MPLVSPAFVDWLTEQATPELFTFNEMDSEAALKQLAFSKGFDTLRKMILNGNTEAKRRASFVVVSKQ